MAKLRKTGKTSEWAHLQRKIFSRWVGSKLASRRIEIHDCVSDLNGYVVAQLAEILSETDFPKMKQIKKAPKLRAQKLDGANLALQFLYKLKIEMELKPSPENIIDQDEKLILGLIWGLMRKFVRFSDDEGEGMNPEEQLLMWVNNQTSVYPNIKRAKRYPAAFLDGTVLCAIIHRNRPKLIDLDALAPANSAANVKMAFEAAEKYFGLEQFLTVEEFSKLDDKSMFVYVSEYFYGVARMRKFELATKRVSRLIDYTRTNDNMKGEFNVKSQGLRDHLDQVMAVLNDRKIDNTMGGAKGKLAEFSKYKEKDKSEIAGQYLNIESYYNHLAMRLADNNRPAYEPPHATSLPGLHDSLKQLEETEQERSVALHKELNRQIRLTQESGKHGSLFAKLEKWVAARTEYLNERETVTSTNEASYQITKLDAFEEESKAVRTSTDDAMKAISSFLESEHYESMPEVQDREAKSAAHFAALSKLSADKRLILDDHLARETFNEKLRLDDGQHANVCEAIDRVFQEKKAYYQTKETVDSVPSARAALSALEAAKIEIADFHKASVPRLGNIYDRLKQAVYKTAISQSKFENIAELDARVAEVTKKFNELDQLYAKKREVLDDDMKRETFAHATDLKYVDHCKQIETLNAWCVEKVNFLKKKEEVNSISNAKHYLSQMDAFVRDKDDRHHHAVGSLTQLGKDIIAAKYDSGMSSWKFDKPDEIKKSEADLETVFAGFTELYDKKKAILDDDLAREEFKEKIRLLNDRHVASFQSLSKWCDEKDTYLKTKEKINSISEAQHHLSLLETVDRDKKDRYEQSVGSVKKLGVEIVTSRYDRLTQWQFETPDEIKDREAQLDTRFDTLQTLYAEKKKVVDDDLEREEFKAHIRRVNDRHINFFDTVSKWCDDKDTYLGEKEVVNSIPDAKHHLSVLAAFFRDKNDRYSHQVGNLKALGDEITSARYNKLSQWQFETPEEIKTRESNIDDRFDTLSKSYAKKKDILDDDLAREEFKARTLLMNKRHIESFTKLSSWCTEKDDYLKIKEEVNSIPDAKHHLSVIAAFLRDKDLLYTHSVGDLNSLGVEITTARYKHITEWQFETPEEIKERETNMDGRFKTLQELYLKKKEILDDDLAREQFKAATLLLNDRHVASFKKISTWCDEKDGYLQTKETVNSISDAKLHLSVLEGFFRDKEDRYAHAVGTLKKVGQEIISARYDAISKWQFETPEEIGVREKDIDGRFETLATLYAKKKEVLDDDLAREEFKARILLLNDRHTNSFKNISKWCDESDAYLKTKEEVNSIADAQKHLSVLDNFLQDKNDRYSDSVAGLKTLGQEIVTARYSDLTKWQFETPEEVKDREQTTDTRFETLSSLYAKKKEVLDDDLAREEFKAQVLLQNDRHINSFDTISKWCNEKDEYLQTKEVVNSIADAQGHLSVLEAFVRDKKDQYSNSVGSMKDVGQAIKAARYSHLTKWQFETPEDVDARESKIDERFAQLDKQHAQKKDILDDDLAREIFKAQVLLLNDRHINAFDTISEWCTENDKKLAVKEVVNSIADAKKHLSVLSAFKRDKDDRYSHQVANVKAVGQEIKTSKYEHLTKWQFETPQEIDDREAKIDVRFETLTKAHATKKDILDDDLDREEFKARVLLQNDRHVESFESLSKWCNEKDKYLKYKEQISSVPEAQKQLSVLSAFARDKDEVYAHEAGNLKTLGGDIKAAKYKRISAWQFETPQEIDDRESKVEARFVTLGELRAEKQKILDDDLAREEFKAGILRLNDRHVTSFDSISKWCAEQDTYLAAKESVASISDAKLHLAALDAFQRDKADQYANAFGNLKTLGKEIVSAKYEDISKWQFETPDEIKERESNIDTRFSNFEAPFAKKKDVLDDDLAREEFKAHVLLLNDRHVASTSSLSKFCDDKAAYYETKEDITSIADAQLQISRVELSREETKDTVKNAVSSLKALGEEIRTAKYEKISSYTFAQPDEVTKREKSLDTRFEELPQQATKKEGVLKDALEHERKKEHLRVRYADLAADFRRWTQATTESVADTHFGFSLEEVEAWAKVEEVENKKFNEEAKTKQTACNKTWDEGVAQGVTENAYTSESTETLDALTKEVAASLAKRAAVYAEELKRQQDNDALCKRFADAINAFSEGLTGIRSKIASSTDSLDDQLVYVKKLHDSNEEQAKVPPIEELQKEIDGRGISYNRHTFMSLTDVTVLLEQFSTFLERKATMLAEEIDLKKMRGLTMDQYKEIEGQYREFDTDDSGALSRPEIKACLFSLGEEVTNKQVTAILNEFGDEKKEELNESGFKEFMIGILGTSVSRDEILAAFDLIMDGAKCGTDEQIDLLNEADLKFLKKTAPAIEGGWDYTSWTDEMFAR